MSNLFKWLLYAALLTCGLATLLLLTGFVAAHAGWSWLVASSYDLARHIILLAFLLLMSGGCGLLLQSVLREIVHYFRSEARALRRLMTLHIHGFHIRQRQQLEKRQIRYWYDLKRQRLSANDDKRHSRALYKAIQDELESALAPEHYKTVRKHLKHYRNQANPRAMLALREQVLDQCSGTG